YRPNSCFVVFFFFQAEDGIRDGHVTGVQTCALPILNGTTPTPSSRARIVAMSTRSPGRSTWMIDRKSTRLNSSHVAISYAVLCLKKKKTIANSLLDTRHRIVQHLTAPLTPTELTLCQSV